MSKSIEKYNKIGIKTSYISTLIGISLVLFMIGIVLSAMFGLSNIQSQAKESLQGDIFFKPTLKDADIKQIELRLKSWPMFKKYGLFRLNEPFKNSAEKGKSKLKNY